MRPAHQRRTLTLTNTHGPEQLAFDNAGNLWVAAYGSNSVFALSAADITVPAYSKTPLTTLDGGGALSTHLRCPLQPGRAPRNRPRRGPRRARRRVAELGRAATIALPSRVWPGEPLFDALLDSLTPSPARSSTSARSAWSLGRDVTRGRVRRPASYRGSRAKCLYRARCALRCKLRRTGMDATFVIGLDRHGAWTTMATPGLKSMANRSKNQNDVSRYAVTFRYPASFQHGWQRRSRLEPRAGT